MSIPALPTRDQAKAYFSSRTAFLTRALIVTSLLLPALLYVISRYTFTIDIQTNYKSLPFSYYLIDRKDHHIARNDLVAFRAARMVAPFKDGMLVVKYAVGLPGDHVVVTEKGVWVNDVQVRENTLSVLGVERGTPQHIKPRNEIIPPGHFFVVGTTPRSYDSRYWGYVEPYRIVGLTHPIL